MSEQPQGAVIEIIERRKGQPQGGIGEEIVVPTEVRINGTSLLMPNDGPIQVHEFKVSGNQMVLVTLTLIAKRVVIGAEWPEASA